MDNKKLKDTALGGILNNPVFVLALGMCPTIAKSANIASAFAMGATTALVLIFSNLFISLLRKAIPDRVRLPAYLLIVFTFVTVVQMFVASFLPSLDESIGAFIPLIGVNCIILGRAEAFASKNKAGYALLDGVSMGLGFLGGICLLGAVRQLLVLAGFRIFSYTAGGFLALGFLMALFNYFISVYGQKKGRKRLTNLRLKKYPESEKIKEAA